MSQAPSDDAGAERCAIRTHRLTKHYGQRRVVDSLDLSVRTGSVYGFLGRNGAGKSTTIGMLTGMVRPDSGRAEVLGERADRLSPATRSRVCYLAEGHPLYGWMRIEEAVRFTRSFYPDTWNDELCDGILAHFGLSRRQRCRTLSRGQKAQVSLALGVAPEPELLILDDPTLGLDTVVRRDFLESLIQIIQRDGRTILFSSHNLGDVERVADRVGVMIDGVLRVDCPTETFRESVTKVVLTFHGAAPDGAEALAECPGLVSAWTAGSTLEVVLVGYDDAQRAAVEALEPRAIDRVDLNLEEAFIEYTRGRRRPLPFFATRNPSTPSPGGAAHGPRDRAQRTA
ncbi:MAG: ABC transporter ATP-binding protein [Planctomycetota bacterium]